MHLTESIRTFYCRLISIVLKIEYRLHSHFDLLSYMPTLDMLKQMMTCFIFETTEYISTYNVQKLNKNKHI